MATCSVDGCRSNQRLKENQNVMLFASLDPNDMATDDTTHNSCYNDAIAPLELETEMKTEGLRYLGGYIAFKFPQFEFLGSHVKAGEGTWNEAASRSQECLMTPSDFFFSELKKWKIFLCVTMKKSH